MCRPLESCQDHPLDTNAIEERKYILQNASSYFISI